MNSIPRYKGRSNISTMIVYFSCLYFCLYYLCELFTNRYSTYFELKKSEPAFPSLSICISIDDATIPSFCSLNLTSMQIENENSNGRNFDACTNYSKMILFYLDKSTTKNPKELLKKAREYELNKAFIIRSNGHEFDSYFLNSGHLCFKFNIFNSTNFSVHNNYKLTNNIFLHETLYAYDYNEYTHLQTCRPFERCEEFSFNFFQFFYKSMLPPYGSSCRDYLNTKLKFQRFEIIDHETICYQECMKQYIRPTHYFYSEKDNQTLSFKRHGTSQLSEQISVCRKECGVSECNQVRYFMYKKMHPKNYSNYFLNTFGFTNQEKPFLGTFDFYLQVIGFISLLFSISLNVLLSKLSLVINVNYDFRLFKPIFIVQYTIYFLACSYAHSISFSALISYINETPQSVFTIGGRFDYNDDFHVHICFPLSLALNRTNDNSNITTIKEDTEKLLEQFTLKQLDDKCIKPEELIKKIYYNYYYKLNENQLNVKRPYSFAFTISNYSDLKIYSKCYTYKVHKLYEPTYRALLQESKFIVETKTKVFSLFLTDTSKTLNFYTKQQLLGHSIEKSIESINPKDIACEFYEETKSDCDSYANCLNNCILSKYAKQFQRVPSDLIVDEKMFLKNKDLNYDLNFTDKLGNMEDECKKNLKPDCESTYYTPGRMETLEQVDEKKWEISLHFIISTKKTSRTDSLTLMINITTIYSILMSFSFPIFLETIKLFVWKFFQLYACLKTKKTVAKFSDDYKKLFKYLRILKLLITWIFFVHYIRIVYRDSVYGTVSSALIRHNLHTLYFPIVGFCFQFMPKRLTVLNDLDGHKLEQMSSNLTVDSVFDRIFYIDETYRAQIWESGDEFSNNLKVRTSYYRKTKCFEIVYKLNVRDYNLNRFNYGLQVKIKDDLPFNVLNYYSKSNTDHVIYRSYTLQLKRFYQIFFDNYKFTVNDMYQGFRNPLFWFVKPTQIKSGRYLPNLREEFERVTNYTTLLLPLDEKSFNYTIKNDLFEKYCEEVVKERESFITDINVDVEVYRDIITETYNDTYTFNFSKRIFAAHQVKKLRFASVALRVMVKFGHQKEQFDSHQFEYEESKDQSLISVHQVVFELALSYLKKQKFGKKALPHLYTHREVSF